MIKPPKIFCLREPSRFPNAPAAGRWTGVSGQSESRLNRRWCRRLFCRGADDCPLVHRGRARIGRPHATRARLRGQGSDALLLDSGARRRFAADITARFSDHVTTRGARLCDDPVARNMAGLAVTRAGVSAHDIDDAVNFCGLKRRLMVTVSVQRRPVWARSPEAPNIMAASHDFTRGTVLHE